MTTNAKDEKRPPPQNRPNEFRRAILEMLRSFAESGSKICIPITINVAGCFVAGEMISYSDYVKLTFRGITDIFRQDAAKTDSPAPPEFHSMLKFFDSTGDAIGAFPPHPGCIWLKKVRIYAHHQANPIVAEPVLEVETDRISAFVIGHLI